MERVVLAPVLDICLPWAGGLRVFWESPLQYFFCFLESRKKNSFDKNLLVRQPGDNPPDGWASAKREALFGRAYLLTFAVLYTPRILCFYDDLFVVTGVFLAFVGKRRQIGVTEIFIS